jgi:hypothetical protein
LNLAVAFSAVDCRQALARVAKRVADREPKQHAANAVGRYGSRDRLGRTLQQAGSGRQKAFGDDAGGEGQC